MTQDHPSRPPNRLAKETSPYLLQHAYNPVDWYPWGPEALQKSQETNRPILLSIGYSACHWCHVMERESFENEQIAALMNEHFVCIKVDREERPDLDEIYMQATIALNQGQGGWPMTVFLTPDQKPIFAGTYFPPSDRYGRPGFSSVLQKVAEFWRKDPQGLQEQAEHLTERLRANITAVSPMAIGATELDAAVQQFAEEFDPRFGGFGGAPKFPPATGLSLLLRAFHRTGDPHTLMMVEKTLQAMAQGGLYDQIGGGFARYSTDERWLVPHFEKMLYDNALLIRTYLEAYQVTQKPEYRTTATETLDYVLREMTALDGGFYSATDADSEGVEGKFFVWTPDQIRSVLTSEEESRRICAFYDITSEGNWEGQNILHRPKGLEDVAQELGITAEELSQSVIRAKSRLYQARLKRVPPGLDDKVLTAWNGMMISAMAEGARVCGEVRYRQAAEEAADFLLRTMVRSDGGLFRTFRNGTAHLDACLEDYAYVAEGLIDLYEAGGHRGYLQEAVSLAERMLADFADAEYGGFFTTAVNHEVLILRSREGPDGAIPSGNAVAASVLARLGFHFNREDFQIAAKEAVRAYGKHIARYPRAFAKSLAVVDNLISGPIEIALLGSIGEKRFESLRQAVNQIFLPNRIIAHYDPEESAFSHPLLEGKTLINGAAALYVCKNFSCQVPITDPSQVANAIREQSGSEPSGMKALEGEKIPGHATIEGTAAFAVRMVNTDMDRPVKSHGYGQLGGTGLTTSKLGFGGYRIESEEAEHRAALIQALESGWNLIDTSTNYTDGSSERLVGSVLASQIKQGLLRREEVIIVSKIGYVQGNNLKRAETRERAGSPFPDMVKHGEGLWHCIHPEFLEDQLTQSLDRLGLATLDVCLLHNPEYFLSEYTTKNKAELPQARDQFYARLAQAFEYLENQVAQGVIQYYGVSSNTSTAEPDHAEATSLGTMLDVAAAVAQKMRQPRHHFQVLQCPMNLYESGAVFTKNTGSNHDSTILEIAQRNNLTILVNRPLNAIPSPRGGMVRLVEWPAEAVSVTFEEQQTVVRKLEARYTTELAPQMPHAGQGLSPSEYFHWAQELERVRPQIAGVEHWEQIENQMIAPHLNRVLHILNKHFTGDLATMWESWRNTYLPELLTLLKVLRSEATEKSRNHTAKVKDILVPLLPATKQQATLSQQAIWVLSSTPGVACVLNGARTPGYVNDSSIVLEWEPLANPLPIYQAMQDASNP